MLTNLILRILEYNCYRKYEVSNIKRIMFMCSVCVFFAVCLIGCSLKHFGTDTYYVQITNNGEKLKEKNINYLDLIRMAKRKK